MAALVGRDDYGVHRNLQVGLRFVTSAVKSAVEPNIVDGRNG